MLLSLRLFGSTTRVTRVGSDNVNIAEMVEMGEGVDGG